MPDSLHKCIDYVSRAIFSANTKQILSSNCGYKTIFSVEKVVNYSFYPTIYLTIFFLSEKWKDISQNQIYLTQSQI